MLMRKLIILNTTILIIVIVILVSFTLSLTNRIVYDETMNSYSRTMDVGYDTLAGLFSSAQRLALDICIDKSFQKAITANDFEVAYYQNSSNVLNMDNIIKEYNGQNSYLTAEFYPLHKDKIYRYHYQAGLWVTAERIQNQPWMDETISSSGDFIWNVFQKENSHVIRVSKLMYGLEDLEETLGVVYVDIHIEPIEYVLYSSILSGKGVGYLIDDNNKIILPYHSDAQLPEGMLLSKGAYSGVDGNNLMFAKSFPLNNWKIAGIVSNNVLMEKSVTTNRYIVFVGVILGLLSMLLASIIIRGVFKPMNRLAYQMESLTQDELPQKMQPPSKQGEITTLYTSFNHMIDRIHELIQGINLAKKKEKEAEMMALQAQINPHFLYNTLDSVNWMAMKYGASDIQTMVVSLSRMMRFSLRINENIIPVGNEIEQVKNYIKIMSVRYPGLIHVEYDIDESMIDCYIIRLILQPLVENAIIHGFTDLLDTQSKGNIVIKGEMTDDKMYFEVRNDGKEGDMQKINKLLKLDIDEKANHYGIRNVHYRLKEQYGTGLSYEQEGKWLVVRFIVPLE